MRWVYNRSRVRVYAEAQTQEWAKELVARGVALVEEV